MKNPIKQKKIKTRKSFTFDDYRNSQALTETPKKIISVNTSFCYLMSELKNFL